MRMNVKRIQDVLDNASNATGSVQCGLASTQTLGTGCPPWLSHSTWALSVSCVWVQCCFVSTKSIRSIREPRTATLTFTQLLISEPLVLIQHSHRPWCLQVTHARWVMHAVTNERKMGRMQRCSLMLHRFKGRQSTSLVYAARLRSTPTWLLRPSSSVDAPRRLSPCKIHLTELTPGLKGAQRWTQLLLTTACTAVRLRYLRPGTSTAKGEVFTDSCCTTSVQMHAHASIPTTDFLRINRAQPEASLLFSRPPLIPCD